MGDLGSVPGLGKSPWRSERLYSERLYSSVCWPGEFHVLYSPWSHKELDMTEQPSHITSKVFFCLFVCLTSKAFKIISKLLNIAYIFLHYSALNSFSPPHPHIPTLVLLFPDEITFHFSSLCKMVLSDTSLCNVLSSN